MHYDLVGGMYTTTLRNNITHTGSFELSPMLRIPDLGVEADVRDFARHKRLQAYLKVYSALSGGGGGGGGGEDGGDVAPGKKRSWRDNHDVVMRAAQDYHRRNFWLCARTTNDTVLAGLGDMLPVPVGLLVILRGIKKQTLDITSSVGTPFPPVKTEEFEGERRAGRERK